MPDTDTTKNKPKRNYNRIKPSKVNPVKASNLLKSPHVSVADAAKILNCSKGAIYQSLKRSEIMISDYDLNSIKNNEVDELTIITHHARQHLYKLLLAGKLKGIETTAILDRCFQQRRELQGKGHSSVNIFTMIVAKADERLFNAAAKVVESTTSSIPAINNQPIVQPTT